MGFETSLVPLGIDEFESEASEDVSSSGEFEALVVRSLQRQEFIATNKPKRIR